MPCCKRDGGGVDMLQVNGDSGCFLHPVVTAYDVSIKRPYHIKVGNPYCQPSPNCYCLAKPGFKGSPTGRCRQTEHLHGLLLGSD